jgi:hypothetical protein
MGVFDDIERSDTAEARHSESHGEFLNRVHTRYWQAAREVIELWWKHLPPVAADDVRARLRARDDRQFHAAFWELYLHESLRGAGYEVECHPDVPGSPRHPDFLASRDGRPAFYLEARATSDSDDEVAATKRRNRIYDSLNLIDSPNFFLWVDVEGEGATDPTAKGLRSQLEKWLARLDPDAITERLVATGDIRAIEPFEWKSGDWYIVFRPWPKAPDPRDKPGVRPVGVRWPGQMKVIDEGTALLRALQDRAGRTGTWSTPTSSLSGSDGSRRTSSTCSTRCTAP